MSRVHRLRSGIRVAIGITLVGLSIDLAGQPADLDQQLKTLLAKFGFTGTVQGQLEKRLGRAVNPVLRDLGRDLFFDPFLALGNDNSCAGCHVPRFGFGDSQSIAIGVENNGIAGPGRSGPRNQRRTPGVINSAYLTKLMWNGRFSAPSGDPFDNSRGFEFPPPESTVKFPPFDGTIKHLLAAQAHIPSTELPEMAGFKGTEGSSQVFSRFGGAQFTTHDRQITRTPLSVDVNVLRATNVNRLLIPAVAGDMVPAPDSSGSRNEPIRLSVLNRLQSNAEYKKRFAEAFPSIAGGQSINFEVVGRALAEFEISLNFADAPIDQYARGKIGAMTPAQKRGAITFLSAGRCWQCHSPESKNNEMFSDFAMHNIGVPQIAPDKSNVEFAGSNKDEDFGLQDITKRDADRYKFRTSPLRNVAMQPTFMHNGAFTRLEDAIRHHLNVRESLKVYEPRASGVAPDLGNRVGPSQPLIQRLSPLIDAPVSLSKQEFDDLVEFVRVGLQDVRATPAEMCKLVPKQLPSGRPLAKFEGC